MDSNTTPVPPAKPEGPKREVRNVGFQTGRVVILEGIYFVIVGIDPKNKILQIRVMSDEEVERAIENAKKNILGDPNCEKCKGTGFLAITAEGPNKGKIKSCDCKKKPQAKVVENAAATDEVKVTTTGTGGPSPAAVVSVQCTECKGTGKVKTMFRDKDCPVCNGNGTVQKAATSS